MGKAKAPSAKKAAKEAEKLRKAEEKAWFDHCAVSRRGYGLLIAIESGSCLALSRCS